MTPSWTTKKTTATTAPLVMATTPGVGPPTNSTPVNGATQARLRVTPTSPASPNAPPTPASLLPRPPTPTPTPTPSHTTSLARQLSSSNPTPLTPNNFPHPSQSL